MKRHKATMSISEQELMYARIDARNCKEEDVNDGIDVPFWFKSWEHNVRPLPKIGDVLFREFIREYNSYQPKELYGTSS
jgi:hypothetical protein